MRSLRLLPSWPRLRAARYALALIALLALPATATAQLADIQVVSDASGQRIQIDGEDFMILGMNWDYFPIGTTTPGYNFWGQPEDMILAALDREMSLLQAMGVNAIRVYEGITPRWVEHIYDEYGIWTVLNHPLGRYGLTLDGVYLPATDYSNRQQRDQLIGEIEALVDEFEGTRGLLMWLLGNENNYGLVWSSAETEDLPSGEADVVRARYLYETFGEAVRAIKAKDQDRLVSMANGDLQYIDIIAEEVQGLDVMGSNVYRGRSARDFFQEIQDKMGIPALFTEFGADAFNARELREDQVSQADFLLDQWQEIYEQSAGKGRVGNAVGGLTFQWSDGWWKFGQTERLDIQDTNASWANDAYPDDYVEGENNMNEEWWGIVAKGEPDSRGLFELFPRAAYYGLMRAYELDPYGPGTSLEAIRDHYSRIQPQAVALQALGDKAAMLSTARDRVHLSGLRMEFETYSTGGSSVSTPEQAPVGTTTYPAYRGFDQMQSFFADLTTRPVPNLQAGLTINLLGDVPTNPIDEIFYENRGRLREVEATGGDFQLNDIERLKIYSAAFSWQDKYFNLEGFYRAGRYHWAYEGDFFNLFRESNYGPNLDIYNGIAPVGLEIEGKKGLEGLKLAVGPQLWWGANPTIMGKYQRQVGPFETTAIIQEDLASQSGITSSFAIPTRPTRKATLHMQAKSGGTTFDIGGIWAGDARVGETFQLVDGGPDNYQVRQDQIKNSDTFGGKAKLTVQAGRLNWYAQGAAQGLVAEGGYDQTQTFTGWWLKDTGAGNRWSITSGMSYQIGNWQVSPNFMWQKPIVGPVPSDAPVPARPRNILTDPFAVRGGNRESTSGELRLTYDPTPATWMYTWDNDMVEDADFAASIGFIYRSYKTTQDSPIGIFPDGRSPFAFPGAPPARDLWELNARLIGKNGPASGWIANLYGGTAEPNGDDNRKIERVGADLRVISGPIKIQTIAKFNDWGPYDYHRDFNYTYPTQLSGDVSFTLGLPQWFDMPATRFGVRGTWRSLDQYSPRYCPTRTANAQGSLVCDPTGRGDNGSEWEIRTYMHIGM